ncbi:MAG TPA: cyclase family protein [Thermoanaerobaculia bacterium]|nr:cyclase family protein [Thermoanaerobaculia bacterium]
MSRFVELSHPISPGMTTYPGLPGPVVTDFLSREASSSRYAPGTTFQIGRIEMVANTGTYLDAPFHRFDGAADIAALPLERLAGVDGVVFDVSRRPGRAIDAGVLDGRTLTGRAVLLRTDWSRHWGTPAYFEGHPFLDRSAARALAAAAPALVGIDSMNIDDAGDGERPAHTGLLGAGIPILEHLCNLAALPDSGFRLHAVPPPFQAVGTFPVRAYAILE